MGDELKTFRMLFYGMFLIAVCTGAVMTATISIVAIIWLGIEGIIQGLREVRKAIEKASESES